MSSLKIVFEKKEHSNKKEDVKKENLEELIEKEQYEFVMHHCEKKYEEEYKKEKLINTKASFLITGISLLITSVITLFSVIQNINHKDQTLIGYFVFFIILFLVLALVFTILSQLVVKRYYLSTIEEYCKGLNNNSSTGRYETYGTTIKMYEKITNNKSKINHKAANLLSISFYLVLSSIVLAFIFILIIYGRSFI